MSSEPWLGIFPGTFIFITVLCCNLIASAVEPDVRTAPLPRR
jgi:ABC-type dipeptide/oligopeptide/nickel transport system permease subunit